jgi:hypothetical protein
MMIRAQTRYVSIKLIVTTSCMFVSISFFASNNSTMLIWHLTAAISKAVSPCYIEREVDILEILLSFLTFITETNPCTRTH